MFGVKLNLLAGILFGILSLICFGVQDILVSVASKKIGPLKASFWIAAPIFTLPAIVFFLIYGSLSIPSILLIIIIGPVAAGGLLAFTKGMEIGDVSVIATIGGTWGAITATLGFLFLGESITHVQLFDIILIVIGTMLVSFNAKEVFRKKAALGTGIGYGFIAALSFGVYFFFITILTKEIGWPAATVLVGLPISLCLFVYMRYKKVGMAIRKKDLPLLLTAGLLGLGGTVFYNLGVTYNYAAVVAPISSASPLVTMLIAFLIFGDSLRRSQKVGIVMVVVGLVFLSV